MSVYAIISLVIFFMCFGLSFFGISCIRFEKFCHVSNPAKVHVLMFVLSLSLAYLMSQAVLSLTVFNGL